MKNKIRNITRKLAGKDLITTQFFNIYCDGGQPKFFWLPKFNKQNYHKYWNIKGFVVTWLGRQFFFDFGDRTKLVKACIKYVQTK